MTLTAEQIAAARLLEPATERILRSVDRQENLLAAFLVQQINDRELCAALDSAEEV